MGKLRMAKQLQEASQTLRELSSLPRGRVAASDLDGGHLS